MHKCPRCGVAKPWSAFSRDASKSSGFKSSCRDCDNAKSAEYYARVRGPKERAERGFVPKYQGSLTCPTCGGEKSTKRAKQCATCAGNAPKPDEAAQRKRARQPLYVPKAMRQAVYLRDDWVCHLCGTYVDTICHWNDELAPTLDHIIPRSKCGLSTPENLRTAHRNCNGKRGNRPCSET